MNTDFRSVKIMVTLGPSTRREEDIRRLKAKGVDFVRVNMSHSGLEDLKHFLYLAKKVGIPFVIDTEGSQIRTGDMERAWIRGNDAVNIALQPHSVLGQLQGGDLLYVDTDALVLRVIGVSTAKEGYVSTQALHEGWLSPRKAVVVDPVLGKVLSLPALSEKDYKSIVLGLDEGVGHIAVSYVRKGKDVDLVREATRGRMQIISKVECAEALENLDEIIEKSDAILIDRGDLGKEISMEKVPRAQKNIFARAAVFGKPVFVASNLLESMIEKKNPTRAEIHDVARVIEDGASGLSLAAETAIGKYPWECVSVLQKLIREYGKSDGRHCALIEPHGGRLVERIARVRPDDGSLGHLKKIKLNENLQMDVENIATGVFSPLEGFMGEGEVESVLNSTRLPNGVIWPIPIVLDVPQKTADELREGEKVVLADGEGRTLAILHLEEKFIPDKKEYAQKLYGTLEENHPGVCHIMAMNPVLLGGRVDLVQRRRTEFGHYALTPRQVRRLFEERHWSRVVGFHTRNTIHRSHEYIQLKALRDENCDGLFVHPVVGKKKAGDYCASCIIKSYERMMDGLYPKEKVVLATFNTYSRYAGPREALFTAICRQNFGCSHFVVGRDHTGVGSFYPPDASHKIFDEFPDLRIKPVRFGEVFYSPKLGDHVHASESPGHDPKDKLSISGTEARKMFEKGEVPPSWFMRPEVSEIILTALKNGEEVFVKEQIK